MWLRRKIAGLLAWVGKVTLLFTCVVAGMSVAAHALLWLKTGAWPDTFVLGEPLRETLGNIGVGLPSSSWTVLQRFLNWMLDQPTWMTAFLGGVSFGLVLVTWGDTMERSIRLKLRHQQLMRERLARREKGPVQSHRRF